MQVTGDPQLRLRINEHCPGTLEVVAGTTDYLIEKFPPILWRLTLKYIAKFKMNKLNQEIEMIIN